MRNCLLFGVLCVMLGTILPSPTDAGVVWTVEEVQQRGTFAGYDTSLAFDSGGNPNISYLDAYALNRWDLRVATRSGGLWQTQIVDSTTNDVGEYSSLRFDSNGDANIAYYDWTNQQLEYAQWDGSQWVREVVDSDYMAGKFLSMALDSQGAPHISYYDATTGELRYATRDNGTWVRTTVDAGAGVGMFTSLALDSDGNPHIAYYDRGQGTGAGSIHYAEWNGSSWSYSTVDGAVGVTPTDYCFDISLALDSANIPHLTYQDPATWALKYASWNGVSWDTSSVAGTAAAHQGHYSSLLLDANGTPTIAYDAGNSLMYATWGGSGWLIGDPVFSSVGSYVTDISLARSEDGSPAVAFLSNGVYYAEGTVLPPPPGNAVPEPSAFALLGIGVAVACVRRRRAMG